MWKNIVRFLCVYSSVYFPRNSLNEKISFIHEHYIWNQFALYFLSPQWDQACCCRCSICLHHERWLKWKHQHSLLIHELIPHVVWNGYEMLVLVHNFHSIFKWKVIIEPTKKISVRARNMLINNEMIIQSVHLMWTAMKIRQQLIYKTTVMSSSVMFIWEKTCVHC